MKTIRKQILDDEADTIDFVVTADTDADIQYSYSSLLKARADFISKYGGIPYYVVVSDDVWEEIDNDPSMSVRTEKFNPDSDQDHNLYLRGYVFGATVLGRKDLGSGFLAITHGNWIDNRKVMKFNVTKE